MSITGILAAVAMITQEFKFGRFDRYQRMVIFRYLQLRSEQRCEQPLSVSLDVTEHVKSKRERNEK